MQLSQPVPQVNHRMLAFRVAVCRGKFHVAMMVDRNPLFCAVAVLLAGCAADAGPRPPGYLYHDGNHPGGVVGASPQAIYNATHGTWLWPPPISAGGGR